MSKGEAADRLIETAVRMLAEDAGVLLVNGLRGEDVCLRADISQTTFYRHYNKHSFVDAVAARIVPPPPESPRTAVERAVNPFVMSTEDPRTQIRNQAVAYFRAIRDNPKVTRRLLALSLSNSRPDTRALLRQSYAAGDAIRTEILRSLFETLGASPRAPFTVAQVATALNAVAEGLTLRWRVDPDSVPDGLIGEVVLAIAAAVVDTDQRGEHLDDSARAFADGIAKSREASSTDVLPADPRSALMNAAREEFALRGYPRTTVDAIAERAKVPAPLAKRLFASKQHIVAHALARPVSQLREAVADDCAIGHGPLDVIDRHLHRLARFVHDERCLVDALIAILSADARAENDGILDIRSRVDLPAVIVDVIADAQRRGLLTDKVPAADLADALTDNLLVRCFRQRRETPDDSARFVRDVVLTGAFPR